eukprot:359271-Pyramimonas_sp.AAC.1
MGEDHSELEIWLERRRTCNSEGCKMIRSRTPIITRAHPVLAQRPRKPIPLVTNLRRLGRQHNAEPRAWPELTRESN